MLGFNKIDRLLVRSFIGPFVVTFGIAIFVLTMVMLWSQIDKIIGKNVSPFILLEMIFYLSLAMVTQALPISVLVSSVLVFGNLSERYELSSMKSAGISLMRIMRAPLFLSVLVAIVSFMFANYLIPAANLKFETRLKDIRYQKPTLSLDKGVYNDDFSGFTIWIGDKSEDGERINDVVIYDHSEAHAGRMNVIKAKDGRMYSTPDKKQFVMELYNGNHYQDMRKERKNFRPFLETSFNEYRKVFDLSEFELDLTDEDVHKDHYRMLSVRQLNDAIVRLESEITKANNRMVSEYRVKQVKVPDSLKASGKASRLIKQEIKKQELKQNNNLKRSKLNAVIAYDSTVVSPKQFLDLFTEKGKAQIVNRGVATYQSYLPRFTGFLSTILSKDLLRDKHIFEMHSKFALAVSCIIFLFIGAPMGAIIRKGGFGYPMLIAILFFVGYIMLTTGSREMMKVGSADALVAAWMADLVFLPIGIVLTIQAMNDSKFVNLDDTIRRVKRNFKLAKRALGHSSSA